MNQKSITLIVNDTIIDKMKWEGMPILYDKSFDIINIDDNDKIKQSINSSSLTPGMFAFRNPYKDNSFIAVRQASELHSIKTQLVSNFFATLGAKSVYLEQISIQEGTQTHTFSRTKDNTEKLTFNVNKNNGIFRKSNDATGGFSTSKTICLSR